MNDEVIVTVQQLAEQQGVDYQTASGLLRFLREKGVARDAGTLTRKGKGRTAVTYSLPCWWTLVFDGVAKAA